MSDKIGDYIHWKYTNYLKYGTGTREHPKEISLKSTALQQQRDLVLSQSKLIKNLNKQTVKDTLEAQLNFFYNTRNGIGKSLVKDISNQDLHNSIIKAIQDRFGDLVHVDENLKASISDTTMNQKYGKLVEGGKNNNAVVIYNRIAYIKKYVDAFVSNKKNLTYNQKSIQSGFNKLINEMDNTFKLIITTIDEYLGEGKKRGFDPNLITAIELEKEEIENHGKKYIRTSLKGTKKITIEENYIKVLNETIKAVNRASAAYYTGLAAEMYVALVSKMGNYKVKDEVNKLLNDFTDGLIDKQLGLVGQNVTYSAMNKSSFAVTGHKNNESYFTSFGGQDSIELKATQDKVDVIITLEDGKMLNASVKNYNLSDPLRNITLLSGTNMMKYLSLYQTFVNHYLNITAQATKEPNYRLNRSFREMIPGELIVEANKTLLLTLVLKALAGGVEKLSMDKSSFKQNDMAEIFIVNDNSTGNFKVFFVEDIMMKITSNYQKILDYVEIDNFSEKYRPDMYWVAKNKQRAKNYSDAYSRINALLAQFKSQHLHISLSQSFLNTI